MPKLKVYAVREARDYYSPRTLAEAVGHRSYHRQHPYLVAAHTKTEAVERLRELRSYATPGKLHVVSPLAGHAASVERWLTEPGDVVGWHSNHAGQPVAQVPAGSDEAVVVGAWAEHPADVADRMLSNWARRRVVVPTGQTVEQVVAEQEAAQS